MQRLGVEPRSEPEEMAQNYLKAPSWPVLYRCIAEGDGGPFVIVEVGTWERRPRVPDVGSSRWMLDFDADLDSIVDIERLVV
jgi:hypothetical protein